MSANQVHFYDAANPQNVPSGVYAGVYINGFAWSTSQMQRMAKIFRISVLRESSWGRIARCLDIETGAATPADLPAFIAHRQALHQADNTTAYVNRSNWQECWERVRSAKLPEPLWWVSTLDGTQNVELKINNVVVARPWAVQYQGGMDARYDLSVLHGVNNFVRPPK